MQRVFFTNWLSFLSSSSQHQRLKEKASKYLRFQCFQIPTGTNVYYLTLVRLKIRIHPSGLSYCFRHSYSMYFIILEMHTAGNSSQSQLYDIQWSSTLYLLSITSCKPCMCTFCITVVNMQLTCKCSQKKKVKVKT